MKASLLTTLAVFAPTVLGQQIGTLTKETHPPLQVATCTKGSGCTAKQASVVLDANWRWLHSTSGPTNCYTGNAWDKTLCPDGDTCAKNCALDGADYTGTYGVTTSGSSLRLNFVTQGPYSTAVGSRVYLMDDDKTYQLLKLKNKEFAFDVDVSNMPCGINGALYLVEMDADGGMSKFPSNKAGAKYGTGYCDAQCPHDIKFIGGQANVKGWKPSPNDNNAGIGAYGSCCHEMDLWEANSISTAYTPHVCSVDGPYRCEGTECGDNASGERFKGVCDKDGCDFNSYRLGDHDFYGPDNKVIDTTKPFTVVTQFVTSDGTDKGDLTEIRRIYVQNGRVYNNSISKFPDFGPYHSITDDFCNAATKLFEGEGDFEKKGGLKKMGEALERGLVLVMSIWDDHEARMLWLDSNFPADADPKKPGVARGTCPTTSGKPEELRKNHPDANVKFSNIKWGAIGSTFGNVSDPGNGSGSTTTKSATATATVPATSTAVPAPTGTPGGKCALKWGQCGGRGWTGPTCCIESTCTPNGPYYAQCL